LTTHTLLLLCNRYDGIVGDPATRKLSTQVVPVAANQVLTLKLGIQDVSDFILDSAVYIEAQSIVLNELPVAKITAPDGTAVPATLACSEYTLSGAQSSDPDGTVAFFSFKITGVSNSFSQTCAGSSVVLKYGPTGANLPLSATQQTYTVVLTVSDNTGATASTTITVVVPVCADKGQ
jgi:hypothetical protein